MSVAVEMAWMLNVPLIFIFIVPSKSEETTMRVRASKKTKMPLLSKSVGKQGKGTEGRERLLKTTREERDLV